MNDLFSETSDVFLDVEKDEDRLNGLRRIGSIYRSYSPDGRKTKTFWANVEEFLEKVDCFSTSGKPSSIIEMVLSDCKLSNIGTCDELRRFALSRICLEVESYIQTVQPHSERLSPYRHWISKLRSNDIIISFNYDTLVETVAKISESQLNTPMPGGNGTADRPTLLKLHGSVDWTRSHDGGMENRRSYNDSPLGISSTCNPIIATPGASKGKFVIDFKSHWEQARNAVQNADYIHIVGYRFPESDSAAILNPMRDCKESTKVNIVLGPDLTRPDVVRVRNLVDRNLGVDTNVIAQPFYAQDYLTMDNQWMDAERCPLIC